MSESYAMLSSFALSGSLSRRSSYDDEALIRRAMSPTHSRKRRQHMCGSFTLSDVSTAAEDEDSNNDEELGAFSLDGGFSPAQSVAGDPTDDENEGDYKYGTEFFEYELVGLDDEGDEGSSDAPLEAVSFSPSPGYISSPWLQRRNSSGPPPIKALKPSPAPLLEVPVLELPPPALSLSDVEDEEPPPIKALRPCPAPLLEVPVLELPPAALSLSDVEDEEPPQIKALRPCPAPLLEVPVLELPPPALSLSDAEDEDLEPSPKMVRSAPERLAERAPAHRQPSVINVLRAALSGLALEASCGSSYTGSAMEGARKESESAMKVEDEEDEGACVFMLDDFSRATTPSPEGDETEEDDEGLLGASLLWQMHAVPHAGAVQAEGPPPAAAAGF